jgi:hypothetical protein
MDKVDKKSSVFDRLQKTDVEMADSSSDLIRVGRVSSSIFSRLGSIDEIEKKIERQSIAFSGILKNSPIKQAPRGVEKHRISKKIIMNAKPVSKAMDTDEESDNESVDEKMDADDYKQVKFSPEVEVLEIEPRRKVNLNVKNINRLKGLRADGIKNRLGDVKLRRARDPVNDLLTIRKTITMKPKKIISPTRTGKMKADQSPKSIKTRLGGSNGRSNGNGTTSQIVKRLGNGKFNRNGSNNKSINISKKSAVFDRLGK